MTVTNAHYFSLVSPPATLTFPLGLLAWTVILCETRWRDWKYHNSDVIMIAMASQITGVPFDCTNVRRWKKTSKLRVTGLWGWGRGGGGGGGGVGWGGGGVGWGGVGWGWGTSTVTCGYPAQQRTSDAENVSIWWRHNGGTMTMKYSFPVCFREASYVYTYHIFVVPSLENRR